MFSKELAALAGLICFTTAYPIDPPTPAAPNTAGDCSAWEVAFYDSTCEYIANNWLISVDDFTSWNPSLDPECKLTVGNSYCVERNFVAPSEPPTFTSSPPELSYTPYTAAEPTYKLSYTPYLTAEPTSNSTEPTSSSTTRTFTSNATTPPPSNSVATPSPIQSGMVTTCNKFYYVLIDDRCYDIAVAHSISLSDFYTWNPALNACTALYPATYICVGVAEPEPEPPKTSQQPSATLASTPTSEIATSTNGNGIATPTPVQPGMTDKCNGFYFVQGSDICFGIARDHGIELDQFYAWNPAVGSACESLWPTYHVCVSVSEAAGIETVKATSAPKQRRGA